jgi:hypothetical protein
MCTLCNPSPSSSCSPSLCSPPLLSNPTDKLENSNLSERWQRAGREGGVGRGEEEQEGGTRQIQTAAQLTTSNRQQVLRGSEQIHSQLPLFVNLVLQIQTRIPIDLTGAVQLTYPDRQVRRVNCAVCCVCVCILRLCVCLCVFPSFPVSPTCFALRVIATERVARVQLREGRRELQRGVWEDRHQRCEYTDLSLSDSLLLRCTVSPWNSLNLSPVASEFQPPSQFASHCNSSHVYPTSCQ